MMNFRANRRSWLSRKIEPNLHDFGSREFLEIWSDFAISYQENTMKQEVARFQQFLEFLGAEIVIIWSDFAILYRQNILRQEVAIFLSFSRFTYSNLWYDNDKDGVMVRWCIELGRNDNSFEFPLNNLYILIEFEKLCNNLYD